MAAIAVLFSLVATASGSAAGATGQGGVTGCAWALQVGAGGIDGYAADLDAGYWLTSFAAGQQASGEVSGITLSGSFPHGRFMSISAYSSADAQDNAHIYDAQIQPSTGANPYQQGVDPTASGTFQVQILSGPAPADPAPNTLYVGSTSGLISVMYRVYDSGSPADPTGGVGLPEVSSTIDNGTIVTTTHGGCVNQSSGGPLAAGASDTSLKGAASALTPVVSPDLRHSDAVAPQITAPAFPPPPVWTAADVTSLPNLDASYLEAPIVQSSDQLVVIRAQMPSFPNTDAGVPAWAPAQVRYWSICEYEAAALVAAGCVADHVAVESGGVATFVISTSPAVNTPAASGVNWLPWGGAVNGVVVYRQVLASPTFTQSIASAQSSGQISAVLGPYYPQIAYCSISSFEASGASGCLAGSTPTPPPTVGGSSSGGSGGGSSGGSGQGVGKLTRAEIAAALSTEIAPTGSGAAIRALLKAGGYTFRRYRIPEAGTVRLKWWHGYRSRHRRILVASGTVSSVSTTHLKLRVRLSSGGVRFLRHLRRTSLTGVVSYSPRGAATIALSRSFTLSHH